MKPKTEPSLTKSCECGCGKPTNIIKENHPSRKEIKGEFRRFIRGHHNYNPSTITKERQSLARLGKSYEEIYGLEEAKNKKTKLRNAILLRKEKLGYINSPETRKKLSQKAKERYKDKTNHPMYGNPKSKGTKLKISKSHKGKKLSEEHKKKLSEIKKGGILSENTKKKMKTTWNKPEMREYARQRRLKQKIPTKFTSIELKIAQFLKELNIPYKTHKAVMGITQPDFFIEPNICLYCDGDYWHNLPIAIKRDKKINSILKFGGFRVIRLWEHEINVMKVNELNNELGGIKI